MSVAGPPSSSDAQGLKPLDAMLAKVLASRPGEVPVFMAFDNDTPLMTITTAPRPGSKAAEMTIKASLAKDTMMPDARKAMEDALKAFAFPAGYSYSFAGGAFKAIGRASCRERGCQ